MILKRLFPANEAISFCLQETLRYKSDGGPAG
jgi:hypothetical protein